MASETRDGICGICPAGCFITATIADGRLEKVEPREGHPLGMICRIGRQSPRIVHDPDRLLYPQRRKGPRGSGEFERISWDDAFGIIVEKLQELKREHGPEATAIYTGRGSFDMAMCDLFQPAGVAVSSASSVLFPFGSPNTLGVGALCYVSFAMIAPHVTMGEMLITMETDLEQAELIVLWGANPATDSPPLAHHQILRARQRGAEVVAIDPRRAETARETGAEWIPIRPGTDGALALSMISVLIDEELYDEKFVREWTVGFEELARYVQHFRPDTVEGITGVPAETIRVVARRIAAARGAVPVMYTGLEYSDSGVQAIRAVFTLWALAGQLDVPGGLLFRMKENIFPQNRSGLIANPDVRKALGRERFPVYSSYRGESHAIALPDSVLKGEPYRIRSLIVLGGSLITSWPQPELWRRTLAALDFLVCIDRYPTADAAYADILLPATTYYEITSYMRYGPLFALRERLLSPRGEARSDFLIMAELARRLGYGHLWPQDEEEMLRFALEGTGFTLEGVREAGGEARIPTAMTQYRKWEKGLLRDDGKTGFGTPSGKFEIASSILAEHGYPPLPVYTEPGEGPLADPELAKRYPLVFNSGGRTHWDFRSQHHGVGGLAENHPRPLATMSRRDAEARGILDGDPVMVDTARGSVRFTARVTDDIVPGAIDCSMGGGGPLGSAAWQEANVNDLTDIGRFDPISGFPVYKTLLCQVRKADARVAAGIAAAAPVPEEPGGETAIAMPTASLRRVYLDHNATTPVTPEVLEAMLPFLREEGCGNPSSIHGFGTRARQAVDDARRAIARGLNCTARRIVFTGCGSEADTLAIIGAARADRTRRHLITTAIEHPAVLAPCRQLAEEGYELTILPVDRDGVVNPDDLRKALRPDTLIVSTMLANNETGAIQPVAELARIARENGTLCHCDAVQGFGKIPVDVADLGVDLLSVSGHKLHGPKGIGALFVRQGVELRPVIGGGSQEHGLRAGTENVPAIVGFGKAAEAALRGLHEGEEERLAGLRNRLEKGLAEIVPGARRNGPPERRLPNTLSMILPEIRGESLVLFLDRKGIAISSGSACRSGNPEPSHALRAMGLQDADAHCSVRFSLGRSTTAADVDYTLAAVAAVIAETRSSVRFVACR